MSVGAERGPRQPHCTPGMLSTSVSLVATPSLVASPERGPAGPWAGLRCRKGRERGPGEEQKVFPLAQWAANAGTAHPHPTATTSSHSVHQVPSFAFICSGDGGTPVLGCQQDLELRSLLSPWTDSGDGKVHQPPVHLPQDLKGSPRALPGY